ncbi:MAG: hypothetical protein COA44_08415 [Arcobacter sp.]|nr:MAG: hypothetical protein COA44_08415 [Arcobacter sp.]
MMNVKRPIGKRLIRNIIMISTCFSIIATAIQLYSEYKDETDVMELRLEQVEASFSESLSLNLWQDDEHLISVQLKNLLSFHDISFVSISRQEKEDISFGKDLGSDSIEKKYKLTHQYKDTNYHLGTLVLQSSLSVIRDKVREKFYLIAITQTIKTFIVAFIMLYVFSYMVTRHLKKITEFSKKIIENSSEKRMHLKLDVKEDELEVLANNLNILSDAVYNKLQKSNEENKNLGEANELLQEQLKRHEAEGENIFIKKDDLHEIEKMMNLMESSSTMDYSHAEIKQDIKTLKILYKRAFDNNLV